MHHYSVEMTTYILLNETHYKKTAYPFEHFKLTALA